MFRSIASIAVLSTIMLSSAAVCAQESEDERATNSDSDFDSIRNFTASASTDPYILQLVFLWAGLEMPSLPTIDDSDADQSEDQLSSRETTVEYELEPVLITSYSLHGTASESEPVDLILVWTDKDTMPLVFQVDAKNGLDDGAIPWETISLNYDKIQWRYWPVGGLPQDMITWNFSKIEILP